MLNQDGKTNNNELAKTGNGFGKLEDNSPNLSNI